MANHDPSSADVIEVLDSLPAWVAKELETAGSVDDLNRLSELHPPLRPALRDVWAAVERFVAERHAIKAVVEANPVLLTPAADTILSLWAESLEDDTEKVTLWAAQSLLRRFRDDGIAATLSE